MKLEAEFKECPDCKVDSRLMNDLVEGEKAKGNMSKDAIGCTQILMYSNVDPLKPPIAGGRLPGARVYRDICKKCGRDFTIRIETGHVTLPVSQGQPPTFA